MLKSKFYGTAQRCLKWDIYTDFYLPIQVLSEVGPKNKMQLMHLTLAIFIHAHFSLLSLYT